MNVDKFLSVASFPFGFESGMWDLIVLVPDHYLSIYFFVHFSLDSLFSSHK